MKNKFILVFVVTLVLSILSVEARTAGSGGENICGLYVGCRCYAIVFSSDQFGPYIGCCEKSAYNYGTCQQLNTDCMF